KNRSEISIAEKILLETKLKKNATLQVLNNLESQIKNRQSLLNNLTLDIAQVDSQLHTANEEIVAITNELNTMKRKYAALMVDGYKAHRNHSKIQFIFSARSFNDIVRRINYLKRLAVYRKLQLDLIQNKKEENSTKIYALQGLKDEKVSKLKNREVEAQRLVDDQSAKEVLVKQLRDKEGELTLEIQRKKTQADALERAIKAAIIESDGSLEVAGSTSSFENSMGSLAWPVANGFITERFGIHKHAELRNITTQNNGINISTNPGSIVTPVFAGTVSMIVQVPGLKNSVLVKHGSYYTVYANLEEYFVKTGDVVTATTQLGRVVKNNEGITEVHFELWKGTDKLDPEIWLGQR
ncbi:MAG: murein DD-endopeptidase MepM/ murein hydrolase activator NlpD, partial [Bacteroidia bacterium]